MPKCLSCARGLTNECRGGGCDTQSNSTDSHEELDNEPDAVESDGDGELPVERYVKRARRTKPDAALKDQQSTGRKRAARLYRLDRNAPCEWRGKERQGGGDNPITGCTDGMQFARHHGPDKNTLNNEPGNVHRICHHCHNRWHAANDPDYDPNKPLKH